MGQLNSLVSALHALHDYAGHFAHVLHGGYLAHLELHAELPLYGGDEGDMLQAVPVLDVVGGGLGVDTDGAVVKYILEYPVEPCEYVSWLSFSPPNFLSL